MKLTKWKTFTQKSKKEFKVNIQQSLKPYQEGGKNDIHHGPKIYYNEGGMSISSFPSTVLHTSMPPKEIQLV